MPEARKRTPGCRQVLAGGILQVGTSNSKNIAGNCTPGHECEGEVKAPLAKAVIAASAGSRSRATSAFAIGV